jgi:predicted RND superfamily exporter protein
VDHDFKKTRLFIEVSDYSSSEFSKQMTVIKKRIEERFPGITYGMTGTLMEYAKMNSYLTHGQIKAMSIALVVILLLMSVVLGSLKMGLIGMVPNIAPILCAGAVMGYFDFNLEYLTMTLAPIILGLAVDDTIHFITHCMRNINTYTTIKRQLQILLRALVVHYCKQV